MTVSNGNILRVAVGQVQASNLNDLYNVYEYIATFAGDETDTNVLNAIAGQMDTMYNIIQGTIAGNQTPGIMRVDEVALVGGVKSVVRNLGSIAWATVYDPGGAGDYVPSGCAALVEGLTSQSKVLLKKYLGQLVEAYVSGNFITSALITLLDSFCDEWFNSVLVSAGNELIPGFLSRARGGFFYLLGTVVKGAVAYQRRRKPGVGG